MCCGAGGDQREQNRNQLRLIGNRVYTGAADEEAYFAIPVGQLRTVEEKLTVIVDANYKLEEFHRARAASVPTA